MGKEARSQCTPATICQNGIGEGGDDSGIMMVKNYWLYFRRTKLGCFEDGCCVFHSYKANRNARHVFSQGSIKVRANKNPSVLRHPFLFGAYFSYCHHFRCCCSYICGNFGSTHRARNEATVDGTLISTIV